MPEKITVGYIAGAGHSGSTLLDLLLGSQSGIAGFGELKKLQELSRSEIAKGLCTCGAPLDQCSVWKPVLQSLVERQLCLEMNDPGHEEFGRFTSVMFHELRRVSDCKIIVDSSKNMPRFRAYRKNPEFTCRLIHIVRDGRAVAYSNFRKGRDLLSSLHIWAKIQRNILRYKQHDMGDHDCLTVRYEDLVSDPVTSLTQICDLLGAEVLGEINLDWAGRLRHNIGGNRMRLGESSDLSFDTEYMERISDEDWRRCWSAEGELMSQLGYPEQKWHCSTVTD